MLRDGQTKGRKMANEIAPSDSAKSKRWYKKWWGITIIVLGVMMMISIATSSGKKDGAADTSSPVTTPEVVDPSSPSVTSPPPTSPPTTTAQAATLRAVEVGFDGEETYFGDYMTSSRSCGFIDGDGPCWLFTIVLREDCSDGISLKMPGLKKDGTPNEVISDSAFEGGYAGQTVKLKVSAQTKGTTQFGAVEWTCISF